MAHPSSQAERIARIETLIERVLVSQAGFEENWREVRGDLAAIRAAQSNDKAEIKQALDEDVAELERLKNRGWGIITTIGIAAGSAGMAFAEKIRAIFIGVFGS